MALPPRPGTGVDCETSTARLSIEYWNIGQLKRYPCNPRRHPKKQVQQIAESIKAFGFNSPVLIDSHGRLMCGHGRIAACELLGIGRIPVICVDHLSDAQIRAFQIADNKLMENATWDKGLLARQFKQLAELDLDFSLEATGFEVGEIELLIDGGSPFATPKESAPTELLSPDSEVAVTRGGDVWLLGNSRLFCGSALDEQSYLGLMNGQRANGVFTQPPCGALTDPEHVLKFLSTVAGNSATGALQFIRVEQRQISELLTAAGRLNLPLVDVCVVIKKRSERGSAYRNQHELILVLQNGKAAYGSMPQFERTNVWRTSRLSCRRRSSETASLDIRCHQIPLELIADAIMDVTTAGEIVLDPYLGSGTTLIAAESTGRIGYAIESDPIHVDQIVRRWQRFAGTAATHEQCGFSFDQMAEVRNGQR